MTDLLLMPEVDDLVRLYLQTIDDLTAEIDDRTYTIFPAGVEIPAVRVHQFTSTAPVAGWLDSNLLQIDAVAEYRSQASRIGRIARAALRELHGVFHDGVVTGVTTFGWRYLPDDSYPKAKPRYIFDAAVHAHPLPTIGS